MNKNEVSLLPKIDLHCHIDGSLSKSFVEKIMGRSIDSSELTAPENCSSLTEYLTAFDLPIKCIQTYDNLKNSVYDILSRASQENVRYTELRFAPYFSLNSSLKYSDICEAVIEGIRLAKDDFGIFSNIIVCAMRHLPIDINIEMLKSCRPYLGHGICALDLAGDESSFDNSCFIELFDEANRLEMPMTIHSGECGSTKNVEIAVECGAKRIGHGTAIISKPSLMEKCKAARVGFELCPTSNFQTGAALSAESYPLKTFLDYGLFATVNTDNRTVSNTTMTDEIMLCLNDLSCTYEDYMKIYNNSIEICFADDNIKHMLIKEIKNPVS